MGRKGIWYCLRSRKRADSVTMDGISESEVPFLFFKAADGCARAFRIKTLVSQRQYYAAVVL